MELIKAHDNSGDWTGHLAQRSSDGWATIRVTEAPASMSQWVGSLISFPPHEIVQ